MVQRTPLIHRITELVDSPKRDCIYAILRHLDLGLCVDIGAAAGHTAKEIRLAGGSNTRVVAFEPFPGNHRFFSQYVDGLDNVRLVKKAVSSRVGTAEFFVPSIVQGTESGWEDYSGYSSLGFISSKGRLKRAVRWFTTRGLKHPQSQKLTVETTTIDTEFAGREIDFMKIDVQGGESEVLRGSAGMLQGKKIHLLYIEWTGDHGVIEPLIHCGYRIYDSTYVAGPKTYAIKPFEEIGFRFLDEVKLSSGRTAYEFTLTRSDISPADAIREVKERGLGWIQTDLIAVSEPGLDRFLKAVRMACG